MAAGGSDCRTALSAWGDDSTGCVWSVLGANIAGLTIIGIVAAAQNFVCAELGTLRDENQIRTPATHPSQTT